MTILTRPLSIAVLAHIRHPVAEPFKGGMEAHCRMLCDGLRAAGHEVTLFAASGSDDPGLVPICPAPYDEVLPWNEYRGTSELAAYQRGAFTFAWKKVRKGGFDVVHNNSLFPDIMAWSVRDGLACVTSQHVPPFGGMRDAVRATAAHGSVQSTVTSASQLELWEPACRTHMEVVANGIDCGAWSFGNEPRDYWSWAGRIVPNKGVAEAVRAAHLAGETLRIFGPLEDEPYFAREVAPWLDDRRSYEGHLPMGDLRSVIAHAKGALVTPMWQEPFGLVAAEALASGTPVCAFDSGAMAEVVGDCGFVVPAGDVKALAGAMQRIDTIDRAACRARVKNRFSVESMIRGYEAAYARAMSAVPAEDARTYAASAARSSSMSSTAELLA